MDKNSQQRLTMIDSLRGLALFGIFLVNITFFTTSLQTISFGVELWNGWLNQGLMLLRGILIDGKFILIFSFLFGFGMVLMQESSRRKGSSFHRLYMRRLLALLAFGLLHGLLIWYGDILTHYAILGFALLLFQRCKPRTLLIWSGALLLVVPVLLTGASLLSPGTGSQAFEPISQADAHRIGIYFQERDAAIYGEGTFLQITVQRINDYIASLFNMLVFYPQILGMFLLGAYFCKQRILHDPNGNRKIIARLIWLGTFIGFPLQVMMSLAKGLPSWVEAVSLFVGAPLVTLAYIGAFACLYLNSRWNNVLNALSRPGRMAFTNYLLQSVICGLIFYSYGLGWFGKVAPAVQMLLVVVIFVLQTAFSTGWLKRFPIGPLEYVWRLFTYWGKPVKRSRQDVSHPQQQRGNV